MYSVYKVPYTAQVDVGYMGYLPKWHYRAFLLPPSPAGTQAATPVIRRMCVFSRGYRCFSYVSGCLSVCECRNDCQFVIQIPGETHVPRETMYRM